MLTQNSVNGILMGVFLLLFAMGTYYWGVIRPSRQQRIRNEHTNTRRKRRTFISMLLAVVSGLIIVGVTVVDFQGRPAFWGIYMGAIIALLLGTIILAIFDSLESVRSFLLSLHEQRIKRRVIKNTPLDIAKELEKIVTEPGSRNGKGKTLVDVDISDNDEM